MLWVPPRHGKSELASVRLPGWYLGRNPDRQIISVSAEVGLAADFGREVRNLVAGQEFQSLFDVQLSQDSQSKAKWHTDQGGFYYAVGVEGSVLGRGGHLVTIDDPYSKMEDAESEAIRRKVWQWYNGTIYNRLMNPPGGSGAIVIIGHRMHEDDLSGMLLAQQAAGGDKWEVVELKALNGDDEEPLCPEMYSKGDLLRIRKNTLPRYWSALYQQNPTPDEGDYFKREWFRYYAEKPKHLTIYGSSDYAVTDKGGDYTVHAVFGVDPDENIYVLDIWRQQTDSSVWIEAFIDLIKEHEPSQWGEEKGQIIKSLDPIIIKRMHERKIYCYRKPFPSVSDKATRCRAFQARIAMGKVYFPIQASWLSDLEHELLAFPRGKNDDIVDCLSLLGRMLADMVGGTVPEAPEEKIPDDYTHGDDRGIDEWRVV